MNSKATLNHIALYVVDMQTSTSFYRDIIGLDTIPEPFRDGKHTWFGIGVKSHLHLIEGARAKTAHEKNNHLCFTIASVPEFTLRLKKNNIAGEKMPLRPGLTR